jgi:hypothetical protein
MPSSYDLPLRINESTCSDLEFAEIKRWVRKRILEKLEEWKSRDVQACMHVESGW